MKDLLIGDVAERAGVKASAVRYYESIGLLPPPPRRGGRRHYDRTILDRLRIIDIAKSLDFTLDEIRLFFDGVSETSSPGEVWRAFANAKMKVIEEKIARARHLHRILEIGLSCKCLKLSDCTLSA